MSAAPAAAGRRLSERIERFTVRRGAPDGETLVLLVPPPTVSRPSPLAEAPLALAFAEAERRLAAGERVTLVAHGATVADDWPAWVETAEGLTLTELGAYRSEQPVLDTRPLAAGLEEWLAATFRGVVADIAVERAFYGSAALRLFQPLFDAASYVENLAAAHPGARFLCAERGWPALPMLAAAVSRHGGSVERPTAAARAGWRARVYAHFAWSYMRAALGQVRNYVRAAPSRARLRRLRRGARGEPGVWVALVPDWRRINAHVLEGVALPMLAAGTGIGVLLCTTLLPGERADAALHRRAGKRLWPGLGELEGELSRIAVDQIVAAESLRELAGVLARGLAAAWAIARRLAAHGPGPKPGSLVADLAAVLPRLAALGTTDVMQALAAEAAVRQASRRHDFGGAKVVFSSVGLVETATADLLLQKAGATTVDFVHGSGGDNWFGATESPSLIRAVWTEADATTCRQQGRRPLVVPARTFRPRERPLRPPRRVLILSSYVHGDWGNAGFPLEPFQTELLSSAAVIRERFGDRLEIRWRPHPNDDPVSVERARARHPRVAVSRNVPLQDDLDRADIVLANPSSTIYQALLAGLPVFVHSPPAVEMLADIAAIDSSRRFFYAGEIAEPLASLVAALDAGRADALAPERKTLEALFPSLGDCGPSFAGMLAGLSPDPGAPG